MLTIIKRQDTFDVESQKLSKATLDFFGWKDDFSFEIHDVYTYHNVSEQARAQVEAQIFGLNKVQHFPKIPAFNPDQAFHFRQRKKQYNGKEARLQESIQRLFGDEAARVTHSRIFVFSGVTAEQVEAFKMVYLCPFEHEELALNKDSVHPVKWSLPFNFALTASIF